MWVWKCTANPRGKLKYTSVSKKCSWVLPQPGVIPTWVSKSVLCWNLSMTATFPHGDKNDTMKSWIMCIRTISFCAKRSIFRQSAIYYWKIETLQFDFCISSICWFPSMLQATDSMSKILLVSKSWFHQDLPIESPFRCNLIF